MSASIFKCEPVAITGLGCISGAGRDLTENITSIFSGRRNPIPSKRIITDHPRQFPVFEIPDQWVKESAPDVSSLERCGRLAWIAAHEGLAKAGLEPQSLEKLRVGVCVGTVVGAALEEEGFYEDYHKGEFPEAAPVERFLASAPGSALHNMLNLKGPFMTVATACTSGSQAIIQTAAWIRNGICDIAITGGAEKLSRISYNGFASLMISDEEPCRPFDLNRSGLNLGEGAGMLILANRKSARKRNLPIIGWLLGEGNACDAYHLARPRFDQAGLRSAINQALGRSGLKASDIAFINAHGTATLDNDVVEGRMFAQVFPGAPFNSTKSYTGHTLGAAGGIEAAITVACLNEGRIPATAGFEIIDPDIGVSPTREVTPVCGKIALSTSVGYGGNNTALILAAGESYG